jgi:hypothetical protein
LLRIESVRVPVFLELRGGGGERVGKDGGEMTETMYAHVHK